MSTIIEMLSGILRFFPNAMISTLFVVGMMTGRLSWIFVAIGGILVTIFTLTIQYLFTKTIGPLPGWAELPGQHVIKACSLLPVAEGGNYNALPSLWVALSAFFATYIFTNANNVYTQSPPSLKAAASISVQQRKGVGLISMLAIIVLFLFLLVARCVATDCETLFGVLAGVVIGITGGYGWWAILNACGADIYPDVHGVMVGSHPGLLRTGPMVCAKK
jgi:uncharacterized BrkB/YihY/UPF0761 family membrane protein